VDLQDITSAQLLTLKGGLSRRELFQKKLDVSEKEIASFFRVTVFDAFFEQVRISVFLTNSIV
jgi:hypothetical protein